MRHDAPFLVKRLAPRMGRIAAVCGLVGLVTLAALSRRQSRDLGDVPNWTPERAMVEAKHTAAYLGAPWEYARLVEPWALTSQDLDALAREAMMQEREERLRHMGSAGQVRRFPRKVS